MKGVRISRIGLCLMSLVTGIGYASAVRAQRLGLPAWEVNAWGGRPTQVEAHADIGRCGPGGFYFAKWHQGDGAAELVLPGTLAPGRAYRFSVQIRKVSGDGVADVFFRRTGASYETTAIKSITPTTRGESLVLSGIHDAPGPGGIRVALRQDGLGICLSNPLLEVISVDQVGRTPAQNFVPSTFFGIHLNKLGRHNAWPEFNPGIVRMWDTGTTWADLQPIAGSIDWRDNPHAQRFDYFAKHVRRFNASASLLVTLGMTPDWAAGAFAGGCGAGSYGARACVMPARLEDWRRYVREVALRYRGQARYWEVLNEADMPMHWSGSAAQLVMLSRAAREELKAIDPGNVVLAPNVTTLGLRLLHDFLLQGGAQAIDAVSMHAYIGRSPDVALSKLRNLREMLAAHGWDLPIWNTESGLSCIPEVDCAALVGGRVQMDGVAALAQAYVGQAALGVANISYYTYEGGVTQAGGLPLASPPGYANSTRAGDVLAVMSRWLTGAEVHWASSVVDPLRRVARNKGGKACVIAWSGNGQEQAVPSQSLGNATRVENALGQVELPRADGSFLIGSLPLMACVGAMR